MNQTITLPNQVSEATDDKNSFMPYWYNFFQDLWRGVRRNLGVKLGGTLYIDTDQKTNSGSLETELMTYEINGGLFSNNNDYLEFVAVGSFASNGNVKTIKVTFGSQTILQTDANAANNGTWQIKGIICRTAAEEQKIICELLSNNSTVQNDSIYPVSYVSGTQNLNDNLNLSVSAIGVSNADIVQNIFIVKFFSNS